jgi:ribulose-phosphate 3-epimerase
VILAASVLAADFARLGEQVAAAERGGAGLVHVDVMDGRFVPNISIGPLVVQALRRATGLPLYVHLMIEDADRWLDAFADAGASWISLHVEAVPHLQRAVAHLRSRGVEPGVALNPSTPLSTLEEILPELHHVLIMSVNPGFGGQSFLEASLDKTRRLATLIRERKATATIAIDGGIDAGNVRRVVEAGVEVVVAGTAVFGGGDPAEGARRMLAAGR